MLTLGWLDGNTFIPVNSALMSSEYPEKRMNENPRIVKRSAGYRQRTLSMKKATETMPDLLSMAKKVVIPARYVLFDSWFSSPQSLHAVKGLGYDIIAMIKNTENEIFIKWQKAVPERHLRYKSGTPWLVKIYFVRAD